MQSVLRGFGGFVKGFTKMFELRSKAQTEEEYNAICEIEDMDNITNDLIEAVDTFGLKIKFQNYSKTMNSWKFYFSFFSVIDKNGKTEFTQLKRIESYLDDFRRVVDKSKLMLKTEKKMLCFEMPKPDKYKEIFNFSEMVKDKDLIEEMKDYKLPFVTGIDGNNDLKIEDLEGMPHLLMAGATGSGKSVFLNNLICCIMKTKTPKDVKFALLDPKCVELTKYKNAKSFLFHDVVTNDKEKTIELLKSVYDEMQYRNETLEKHNVRNIEELKSVGVPMNRLVLIIDEFANVRLEDSKAKKLFDDLMQGLVQMGRACGIHTVLCTQTIRAKIVDGVIKANLPCRISFSLRDSIDSRTILGRNGAECLGGKGDGIIIHDEGDYRFQSPFVTGTDITKIVKEC